MSMTLEQMKVRVEAVRRQARELETLYAHPLSLWGCPNINSACSELDILVARINREIGLAARSNDK